VEDEEGGAKEREGEVEMIKLNVPPPSHSFPSVQRPSFPCFRRSRERWEMYPSVFDRKDPQDELWQEGSSSSC